MWHTHSEISLLAVLPPSEAPTPLVRAMTVPLLLPPVLCAPLVNNNLTEDNNLKDSVIAISHTLRQAMSKTKALQEGALRELKPRPQTVDPKVMQASSHESSDDDSSATQSSSSSRPSSLSDSDTSLSMSEDKTSTIINDKTKPSKKVTIDTTKEMPPLPFRPVLVDLPPLPMYGYIYLLDKTAYESVTPTTSRSRTGSKSRSSTPSQKNPSSRRSSVTPGPDVLDELDAEEFLAPTNTPCLQCKRDGVACVPPRGTRHGQGCCILCRATESNCERQPKGTKRSREWLIFLSFRILIFSVGDAKTEGTPSKRARR